MNIKNGGRNVFTFLKQYCGLQNAKYEDSSTCDKIFEAIGEVLVK